MIVQTAPRYIRASTTSSVAKEHSFDIPEDLEMEISNSKYGSEHLTPYFWVGAVGSDGVFVDLSELVDFLKEAQKHFPELINL